MKENKIIARAKHILVINKGNTSTYYKELKKTLNEYNDLKYKDKTTNNLYLEHISNLCDLIDENRNVNTTLAIVIVTILTLLITTIVVSVKYNDIKSKNDIMSLKSNTSLVVEYRNLDSFELKYSDNYENVEPINIRIKGVSKDKLKRKMRYEVYIKNINTNIAKERINFIVRDNKDISSIKTLENTTLEDGSILIYKDEIECGKVDELNLYLWINDYIYIDNNFDYEIYVNGYEI